MDTSGNYIQNQFCNYEIALKLKELGFNEKCIFAFDNCQMRCSDLRTNEQKFSGVNYNSSSYVSQPLWQQVWSFLDDNGVIIGIIFVDNVFKYTLNIENYVSNEFKDRMSVIKSATEYATNYLWNKKFNK